MSTIEGFGKSKYGSGGGSGYKKPWKLQKDSTLIFRLMPAMKSLAVEGKWAKYYGVHFGYAGVNAKDPGKPKLRPFKCIQEKDNKTKMIRVACDACDEIQKYEDKVEELTAIYTAEKRSEADIAELLAVPNAWLDKFNCDRKWYINAMSPQGEFNILLLSHRTKTSLELEIARLLNDEGIDATDPDQGVWFSFTRTGNGGQIPDTVRVVTEAAKLESGKTVQVTKLAPLSEQQRAQALSECKDLASVVTEISAEQIRQLVKSGNDPEVVDAIFALGQAQKRAAVEPLTAPVRSKPEVSEVEKLKAELAAAQAKLGTTPQTVASPATPAETPTVKVPPPGTNLKDMSDEDFLAQFKAP